jgi:hypothetical protein
MLTFFRGVGRRSACSSIKPPWWLSGGFGAVDKAPFNKRLLLQGGRCALLLLSSVSVHGGAERGWSPASSRIGGDWGNLLDFELIQARGATA